MSATKKSATGLTVDEVEQIEAKVVPYLSNEPSEPIEIAEGYKVVFKRPSLLQKSKSRLWTDRKFKSLNLTDDEKYDLENQVTFYYTFFGAVNSSIVMIYTPEGKAVEFDPKVDSDYMFLFEKFIEKDIYSSGKYETEDKFISTAIDALFSWQSRTEPPVEDIKK